MTRKRNAEDADTGETGDEEDEPTQPAPPDPWAVLAKLADALSEVKAARASGASGTDTILERLSEAMERLSVAQVQGAQIIADEAKRAHRSSNEVVHQRSVLNPRGERDFPKPRLKCPMMIPWFADQDSLTREEVELLNLLIPGEFVVMRNDGTKVKLACKIDYALDEVTPSRLLLNHETAFNNDHKTWMPPLPIMLRQILNSREETKQVAAAVLTMDEELALIAAKQLEVSQ